MMLYNMGFLWQRHTSGNTKKGHCNFFPVNEWFGKGNMESNFADSAASENYKPKRIIMYNRKGLYLLDEKTSNHVALWD